MLYVGPSTLIARTPREVDQKAARDHHSGYKHQCMYDGVRHHHLVSPRLFSV